MNNATFMNVFSSAAEFFDKTHDVSLEGIKFENARHKVYVCTKLNSVFNGNQENVYKRFKNHRLDRYASSMFGNASSLDLDEFSTEKYQYESRLEEGDDINIDRFLDDDERQYAGMIRKRTNRKAVKIYCGFGGNCERTKDELFVNGAIAVTVSSILESQGIGTELWAVNKICELDKSRKRNCITQIRLKPVDGYPDFGAIGYVIGDDHVFRNSMFLLLCKTCNEADIDVSSNLGYVTQFEVEDLQLDESEQGNAIIIPSIYNMDDAISWLRQNIGPIIQKTGENK